MSEAEKLAIITTDFCNALEAAAVSAKRQIAEIYDTEGKQNPRPNPKPRATVLELTFTLLKFEAQEGIKLGCFEIAHKTKNPPEKWHQAYNILHCSNATIRERYHGEDYEYCYWLFGEDRIYRQKLKPKPQT